MKQKPIKVAELLKRRNLDSVPAEEFNEAVKKLAKSKPVKKEK